MAWSSCVFLHMCRVFYTGSYKKPRQFNWVIGVLLLLLTLGLSFTGYLLPWDQLAFWAITVGTNIGSYAPLVGGQVREILLGGHSVGEAALLRFYVLHVAVFPAHHHPADHRAFLARPQRRRTFASDLEAETEEGGRTRHHRRARELPPPSIPLPHLHDKTYGLMEVVTGKPIFETIAPEEEDEAVFSYPYAFFREAIALMVTVVGVMADVFAFPSAA